MKDKKIYIVRGSEDGNLGVYSNYKKAYEVATNYVPADQANEYEYKDDELGNHSYSATQKVMRQNNHVEWTCWSHGSATTVSIELFLLNK